MRVVQYECGRCDARWTHLEADDCPVCWPGFVNRKNAPERLPVRQEPSGQLVLLDEPVSRAASTFGGGWEVTEDDVERDADLARRYLAAA